MATITDFESWLGQVRPEGADDVYALFRAVDGEENFGRFRCSRKDEQLFLRVDKWDDILVLASDKAVKAFLSTLKRRFNIEGDIEGWYIARKAMERDADVKQ